MDTESEIIETVEDDEDEFLDEELLVVLTQPKAKALVVLAELRATYDAGQEAKRRHDLLVKTAQTLRKDFADVKRIETKGKKPAAK